MYRGALDREQISLPILPGVARGIRVDSFSVKRSPCGGRGLFTRIDVGAGDVLFTVRGRVVRERYSSDFRRGSTWLAVGEMTWVVPTPGNLWRYVNHACVPNVRLHGTRTIVAGRRITRGEELRIDYATTEADPFWQLHCRCGSLACRRVIGGILSLTPDLYASYRNSVPVFLRDYRRKNQKLAREVRRRIERLSAAS